MRLVMQIPMVTTMHMFDKALVQNEIEYFVNVGFTVMTSLLTEKRETLNQYAFTDKNTTSRNQFLTAKQPF